MNKLPLLLFCCCLLCCKPAQAEEQATFNWQFSIGLGLSHSYNLLPALDSQQNGVPQLQLLFDFEYRNWFAETPSLRSSQLFGDPTLGYRLNHSDKHNLAVILATYHNGFGPTISTSDGIPVRKLEGLHNRKTDLMPGLRYQYHAADSQLLSLQLSKDIGAHHGEMLRLFYGFRFEQKNWDLYFNTELSWYSAGLVNYYYGVTSEEARPDRPAYRAGSGWRWHNGVVSVYPLTKQWVMELGTGINWYTRSFTNSPLTRNNPELVSFVLVRYVF
ncbi:MipA/OmpV family protein [Chromatiaceae bacterium AAb-1]|nr:MipA/OmpV family protein [Chromatiaceae bacterium AAb-1]